MVGGPNYLSTILTFKLLISNLSKSSFLLGFFHGSIGYASKRHKEVLQGQENKKTSGQELDAETPPTMPHLLPLSDPDWCHRMNGLENKQCFPMHDHFHQHNRSTIMAPFPTDLWPPIFANRVCDKISISRKISVSNVTISNSGSQEFGLLNQGMKMTLHFLNQLVVQDTCFLGSIWPIVIRSSLHYKLPLIVSLQVLVLSPQHLSVFLKLSRLQSPQRIALAFF